MNSAEREGFRPKVNGLLPEQNDKSFYQFKAMEWGYRAAFRLLRTYRVKYHRTTIRTIIERWAPPNENNTKTYIANVSRLTGIDPDEPLGIPSDRPSRWMALGIAMAIQENGMESLDYFATLKGWDLCRQAASCQREDTRESLKW